MKKQINPSNKKFWQFRAAASGKTADLLLYGPISSDSWWGDEITPQQFAEDLAALGDVDTINVRVNSLGGDVFAGNAIYAMLKRHKAKKIGYVDGIAASMGSAVLMACDVIYIAINGLIMVHHPWGYVVGNAKEFREAADLMDTIAETLISVYVDKTGLSREDVIAFMDAETWFTADKAVENGFADEIEQYQVSASLKDSNLVIGGVSFDLSGFKNFPANAFTTVAPAAQVPPAPAAPVQPTNLPKGGDKTMPLTKEILASQYKDIYDAVFAEGVQAERDRIKAVEEVAVAGYESIITKAKFETGITAAEAAAEIIKADKAAKANYLGQINADALEIKVPESPGPGPGGDGDKGALAALANAFVKGANRSRKGGNQ